jgi:hypothetical protein
MIGNSVIRFVPAGILAEESVVPEGLAFDVDNDGFYLAVVVNNNGFDTTNVVPGGCTKVLADKFGRLYTGTLMHLGLAHVSRGNNGGAEQQRDYAGSR